MLSSLPHTTTTWLIMAMKYKRPANEATKVNHLICWRPSPLERRKRNTMLTAEARMQIGSSGRTIFATSSSHGSASSPNGLLRQCLSHADSTNRSDHLDPVGWSSLAGARLPGDLRLRRAPAHRRGHSRRTYCP